MTIQMKAIKQYFHVVLFIMLYKVVVAFNSLNETLVCDHSNGSSWAVLSCDTVYYAIQGGSNCHKWRWNPSVLPLKWKLLRRSFLCYKVVLIFKIVDKPLVCNHSNENYWEVLPCGTIYYAAQGGSKILVYWWNRNVRTSEWKLLSISFMK